MAEFFADQPDVVNATGGKQSATPYRLDLVDPHAMLALGRVLSTGAERHGVDNWRRITTREHVNHALGHLMGYLAGDDEDAHLENALCRLMFALAMEGTDESSPKS